MTIGTPTKARHAHATTGRHLAGPSRSKARLATLVAVISVVATVAVGLWLTLGSGGANTQAQTVGAGNAPTAVVAGSSVSLSWSASSLLPGGQAVDSYIVSRYDDSGVSQAVGPGCEGVVAGLQCVETGVPNGTWHYSVTPAVGTFWRGLESTTTPVIVAVPIVTSATPNTRGQGFTGNVVLAGSNFVNGATVGFSGTGITVNTVTFNNASQLTVNISIAPTATIGARNITVTNPDGGAGTCTGCLTVNTGPTVTSLNPDFGLPNTTYPSVIVSGSGFVSGATVAFSGTGITVNTVTFNSSTQLTLNITVAAGTTLGPRNVTVTNPDGGSGSCVGCYSVVTGPTITSVTPSTGGQGATGRTLIITGTNFRPTATVPNPGSGVTVTSTTVNSSTQITITVNILQGAALGARTITVTNPTGFGSGSCATCFAVTARPGTFVLIPNSRGQGATSQNIIINGSLFQSGATVAFSGTGITVNSVTFNNANQLNVNISVAPGATTGARAVTITNPDAGFRTTNGAFTVVAAPTPTAVNPNSRPQGFAGTVTITGTGFAAGATMAFSGTGITVNGVTFNNATQLTANITVAPDAPTGARNVTVTNLNAGTATCNNCLTVAARPIPTSLTPPTRARGTAGTHTITGTGFVSGATVQVIGGGVTPSNVIFNSSTQITVTLTVAPGAVVGTRDIRVNNPDTGFGTCTGCLTVS